jgi:hypothetical protein
MSEATQHAVRSIKLRLLELAEELRVAAKMRDSAKKRAALDGLRENLVDPCGTLMRLYNEFAQMSRRIDRIRLKLASEGAPVHKINSLNEVAFRLKLEFSHLRKIAETCVNLHRLAEEADSMR